MDKKNIINNIVLQSVGNSNTYIGDLYRNIPDGNIEVFNEIIGVMGELVNCLENSEALEICMTLSLNVIPPKLYSDSYIFYAINEILNHIEFKSGFEEKAKEIGIRLQNIYENNKEVFEYFLNYSVNTFNDLIGKHFDTSMVESDKNIGKILDSEYSEYLYEFPKIHTMQNVKLYHGTSYDNYLKIKKDGFIKPSDYSDGDYKENENVKTAYLYENGYVFSLDSMDFSLKYCFGGMRKNLIENWAYDNKEKRKTKTNTNIGVIFEIDPTNYEVYFNRAKREFMIKGDVFIEDTKPMFFYKTDNYEFIEMTEKEIRKIWRKNK